MNMVAGADSTLISCVEVLSTSECGDRLSRCDDVVFIKRRPEGNVIRIFPDRLKQSLLGIGTSFTEASAFVLAHLEVGERARVMRDLFSRQGADFTLARTPIGSCDFCVHGRYSYAEVPEDTSLSHFDIGVDCDGFSRERYRGIKDESYDLLPMIREALAIKGGQENSDLRIVASAWTAPPWMKDIGDWFQPPSEKNNHNGSGGVLAHGYESIYADYLVRYLEAYSREGVDIWGLTPVNEPLGNNGQWESMHFTPDSQRRFISDHLGPRLARSNRSSTKLLVFDHSRDQLEPWVDAIYSDPQCARYVAGAAVHWYESTFKVFEDVFERVHEKHPECLILHTEGCIDNLGNDAPEGILDPEGYKETGWFGNDAFWWNDNATDWAYSAMWPGVNRDDHPMYTPVHRYARNIIVSLDHWVAGWIDWNCVLDRRGGPNHVGNYCGAPIMIDTAAGHIHYTPIYYILAQFSRTIRPGDRAVQTETILDAAARDRLYACASLSTEGLLTVQVLNTAKQAIHYTIQLGDSCAAVAIKPNSLQTVRISISDCAAGQADNGNGRESFPIQK